MTVPTAPLAPYLSSLNPEQLEAVLHEGSPLLILAGAGTGKTKVITTKIAYLVRERGVAPESILAVTFTNKAAREMRERAAGIEASCERAVIRTFHSFGAWFLRRNATALGIDPNFIIYDDGDSSELVKAILPEASRQDCNRYASMIARAKDFGLAPDAPNLGSLFHDEEFRRIYRAYTERLRKTGNVDFGDLIGLPQALLERDEAIASRTRQRFSVVLVDEYQDSNVAQFLLLQKLTGPATYVCVVGDDDQSIYRFRGAEVKNILSFSQYFPGTRIVRLERNYRSSQSILDLAGNIVSHNSGRLGKTLRATRPGGSKPQLALLDDQEQEVEYCTRLLRQHIHDGGRLSDVAILYRTNAQSLAFEKDFPRKSIPYRLIGALRFYEREEVKDILAYLSLIQNPRDEIAFRRIVNKPTRGLGDSSVETILETAARFSLDMIQACEESKPSMKGKAGAGLETFLSIIRSSQALIRSGPVSGRGDSEGPYSLSDGGETLRDRGSASLGLLLERIVADSGLVGYHKSQDEFAGSQKLSNMEELVSAASLYPLAREGLSEFLETIELDRSFQAKDASGEKDAVNLITMHNTKGLEFPVVIVTGLEQGLFPRDDEEGEDLEEQRRLFYVSATRAKDRLHLTACRWRRIRGRLFETSPSVFLTEIDPALYEFWKGSSTSSAFGRRFGSGTQIRTGSSYAGTAAPALNQQGGTRVSVQPPRPQSPMWRQGQAVYHDEYGQGVIMKSSETESSGPLVIVQFDSGKVAQFFPKYTRKLERVKE